MAKVLTAMSGGVDSSVAAALLVEQGHEVEGAYMKNWINEENVIGECPWEQDITDARAVAERLGIPFRIVNLMQEYRERIVHYLLAGYREGVTPNPDVMCNREMKFGVFLEHALAEGFDYIATGHYVRRGASATGQARVLTGRDPGKNQAYFLALLQPAQVERALFPVGDLLKSEVRAKAEQLGLATATKKDSQGICFIGNVKMRDFLRAFVEDRPGPIVDLAGRLLGEHCGLHLYTLGQRRGVGVASASFGESYVVVEKRPAGNELVLALERPDTPRLWATTCTLGSLSSTGQFDPGEARPLQAQPRYRSAHCAASYEPIGDGRARLTFTEKQRALTPGQICAFYDGEVLLGGGIFEKIETR